MWSKERPTCLPVILGYRGRQLLHWEKRHVHKMGPLEMRRRQLKSQNRAVGSAEDERGSSM
ncbi:hypothetical protein FocTR4_00003056 [Fusarium oxysporum f. sp. cubense]|nr:hypothetical protein FocTR4_00003056 [Fusarium oxysporum f. sp. cubense]